MFTQYAYEAFYSYIGLYLHETFITVITSHKVLAAGLVLIFGGVFLFSAWDYFKKYVPFLSGRVKGPQVFFKLLLSAFLGIAILKVDTTSEVRSFKKISWSENQYITTRLPDVKNEYRVSFLFDFLSRSSEEIARLGSIIVDELFEQPNKELEAPAAFYKAVIHAGSLSLDDPNLRGLVDLYSQQCFDEILPHIGQFKDEGKLSMLFSNKRSQIDNELESIPVEIEDGPEKNCLELKDKVVQELHHYAWETSGQAALVLNKHISIKNIALPDVYGNLRASGLLNNFYFDKTESSSLGIEKGAEIPGNYTSFTMRLKRFFSLDGLYNLIGKRELEGSGVTADRALKFSDYLKRAPHIKGVFKLALIAVFPWLTFLIFWKGASGGWRIILAWWLVYTSVALWTPIWVLLYKLMTAIALSTETMSKFGMLVDGISLYSSEFISNRLYQFYAIYTWLQILCGPLPTSILAWKVFSGALQDSEEDHLPEGADVIANVGVGAATGGVGGAASAGARSVGRHAGVRTSPTPKGPPTQQ